MECRHKRVNRSSFMDLPAELQDNIFSRLPVRSLLICKCVCKLFRTVIQNPDFDHTGRTLNRFIPSTTAFTTQLLLSQSDNDINIVLIDNTTNDVISCSPLTKQIPYIRNLFLVGSCNDLVCFYARTQRKWDMLLLWNPVSRKIKYLPKPQEDGFNYKYSTGFCFFPEINDYIVVIIGSRYIDRRIKVAVYKMSTDTWTIHCSNIPVCDIKHQMTPVFVNGSFYWCGNGYRCNIVSYNPKDEEFKEINTPINPDEHFSTEWNIAVIDETLGVMYWNYKGKGKVRIFKMKDYRVQDSWLCFEFRNSLISPLLGWKDYSLITKDSSNLYLYDFYNHKRKRWIPQSGLPRLCSFLDTMAP